ncbi:Fic family protein [Rhodococcus erythropolis]|uniref:Fic family protein n=1 Tax=Rhodococcus erythropolis TaxID=1833 RepID=UPI003A4D76AA
MDSQVVHPLQDVTLDGSTASLTTEAAAELESFTKGGSFSKDIQDEIAREFLPDRIADTLNIEGIRVNSRVTKSVLEGLAVSESDRYNEREILNVNAANDLIEAAAADSSRPLTPSLIREVHGAVMAELNAEVGTYRKTEVVITGSKLVPPEALLVSGYVQQVCDQYNEASDIDPFVVAGWLHASLARIHPFTDGNGRTSRMLQDYSLIRSGYLPIGIPLSKRREYYDALTLSDEGDFSSLVTVMANAELTTLSRASTIVQRHTHRTSRIAQLAANSNAKTRQTEYNKFAMWQRRRDQVLKTFQDAFDEFNEKSESVQFETHSYNDLAFEMWQEVRNQGGASGTWIMAVTVLQDKKFRFRVLLYAKRHINRFTTDIGEDSVMHKAVGIFLAGIDDRAESYKLREKYADPYIRLREILPTTEGTYVYTEESALDLPNGVTVHGDLPTWARSGDRFTQDIAIDFIVDSLSKLGI